LLAVPDLAKSALPERRRELSDAGFAVCGLASSVRFDETGSAFFEQQLETGRAYVELAAELGAGFVRVFGDAFGEEDGEAERAATMARVAEGMSRLGEYAAPYGVCIVLETHGDFADTRVAEAALRQTEGENVGILWDTHHPWRFYGEPLQESFEHLRPWVRHTHWKDSLAGPAVASDEEGSEAAAAAHALMTGHRHANYVLMGEGEFPARQCLELLLSANYAGWLSLEWEKMWHPELAEPEVALPQFAAYIMALLESLDGGTS
jgi:sugar phosphate isomerase/epimerase